MIKVIKLSTNDDVLCEIVEETETKFTVKNAIQIIFVPSQKNEVNFGLAPYPGFAQVKSEIPIDIFKTQIVLMTDPDKQFKEQYDAVFQKIIAPSGKIIV